MEINSFKFFLPFLLIFLPGAFIPTSIITSAPFKKAFIYAEALKDAKGEANSAIGLGDNYSAIGESNYAKMYYEKALKANKKIGDIPLTNMKYIYTIDKTFLYEIYLSQIIKSVKQKNIKLFIKL